MANSRISPGSTERIWEVLKSYQAWFDPALKDFLQLQNIAGKNAYPASSKLSPECLDLIADLAIRGGKRQRVAFLCETVKLFSKKEDPAKLLDAAISIELLQVHLLIHDDIFDNSPIRRGKPTTYAQYKKLYDDKRLPLSMTILAGDIAAFLALKVLSCSQNLTAAESKKVSCIQLQAGLDTFHGQIYDLERNIARNTNEDQLYELADFKAVRSSTWAPMHIGLVLSGSDNHKNRDRIYKYAKAVGIAGQLQDDYLGIFGDEAEMGKSNTSDIAEGKMTLLMQRTFDMCQEHERKELESILSAGEISNSDAERVRNLVKKYKADEYLIEKMKYWSGLAKKEVESWNDLDQSARDFFSATARWFVERKY